MSDDKLNFFTLSVNELLALSMLLNISLSAGLTSRQLNILGNFLCSLGSSMLLIQSVVPSYGIYLPTSAAQPPKAPLTAEQLSDVQRQVQLLQDILSALK